MRVGKMKLLFYIPGLVDGGAERVIATLASQFAQQGHSVLLVVDFKARENSPMLDPAIRVMVLPEGHGASTRRLAKLLVMINPDIALSAIASTNFKLVAASLLARLHGFRSTSKSKPHLNLVLTYHGFEEYKTGWMSWLGYVTLPLISRIAKRVVAVSDSLQTELRRRWWAKEQTLVRIYNPVAFPTSSDGAAPPTTSEALAARDNVVLSVGRLVPDKRFDLVIKAFAKLQDQSASLIILGEGPERQNLLQLVQELRVENRVSLPGFTEQTGDYFARAKCFVLTSKKESFGLVLVEALAFGLPVLSTDCGGPREVLDGGLYGVLLDNNIEPGALAIEIDKVLTNPGDPQPRFTRAKSFDLATGIRHYGDLFDQILRETR